MFPPAAAARTGTVLVLASAATPVEVPAQPMRLLGGARPLADLGGAIPRAPEQRQVAEVDIAPGRYPGLVVGAQTIPVTIDVVAGQVTPVLLAVDAQGVLPAGVYTGNDGVNLGLSELGGKLTPLPDFHLVDQAGAPLERASLLGRPSVIAAFHTTCHETCPLYTGMLLQLRKQVGDGVRIVEVTTDPGHDTPDALRRYAQEVGADWTFATGTPAAVADFWAQFGVTLSTGDVHDSMVLLSDAHGFQRAAWRGVPDVGGTLPPVLFSTLSGAGLAEVRDRGEGWSAQNLADAIGTVAAFGGDRQTEPGGKPAPDFTVTGFDGRRVSLADLRGKPVVINFFAAWCGPCRTELPLLTAAAGQHRDVQFVLLDWYNDDPGRARQLLQDAHATVPFTAADSDGRVGRAYGVVGLPTTVFVRPDGVVDAVVPAQLDEATLAGHLSRLGAG